MSKHINCTVVGKATDTPYLTIDNGHIYHGVFETSQHNRIIFSLDDDEPTDGNSWGYTIFWHGGTKTTHGLVPTIPETEGPQIEYASKLARLAPAGRRLTAGGQSFTWAMMTGFCDYYLLLTGQMQRLRDVCKQSQDLRCNGRRVLGMMHYIADFDPQKFGTSYYTRLPELASLHAEYELRTHFECFADNQVFKLGPEHWGQFCHMLKPETSVVISAGNEAPKNGFSSLDLPYPGVFSSRGSNLADEPPQRGSWGVHMWHGRRDDPKVWMSADDMIITGLGLDYLPASGSFAQVAGEEPIVHDEPMGFAEVDIAGRRSTNPQLAENFMYTGKAYGAGATFHPEDGIFSRLLGPTQYRCAQAFFNAQ